MQTPVDLVSIIRLIRSENIGTKTFWHLISLYKTAENALNHITELSIRVVALSPSRFFLLKMLK